MLHRTSRWRSEEATINLVSLTEGYYLDVMAWGNPGSGSCQAASIFAPWINTGPAVFRLVVASIPSPAP